MFDWNRFLRQHSIEFFTAGPNVRRGELSVRCPFCGQADHSHHMGIDPKRGVWGCLRNREHRGKSPTRLVQALLQCSWQRALSIVGDDVAPLDSGSIMAAVAAMSPQETAHSTKRKLRMPDTFLAIRDRPSAKPFIQYLRGRKFTDQQIFNMSRRYGMRYDSRGPFKGRIIFPVYYNGRLCTFTGRTIHKSVELRYKTLTEDPEKAEKAGVDPALGAIGEYLLWYDDLMDADADTICIVEGPFDALKVDVLGARHGVCATCFFTSQPSDRQIDLMHELLPRFRRRILIPDQNAEAMGLKTSGRIRALNVEIKMMPKNIKDPGEFCEHDLLRFLEV